MGARGQSGSTDQKFDVSLMCDDLPTTMAELTAKGAEFVGEVRDEGWGVTVQLKVPGAGEITLYEPRYDPPRLPSEPRDILGMAPDFTAS